MNMACWHRWGCLLTAAMCLGCATVPAAAPTPPASAAAPVTTGPATIVVGQDPCCPKQTLPEFLGITGLFQAGGALVTRIRSRLGMRFPGLEGRPPVLPITDPANLDSPNPAVSAAAEVKAQEDAADQKIKGLRYLATIGCGGCYPDVEQALLAGLDDCTEAVRYEAASGLRRTAGNPCHFCRSDKCCSPAVQRKLQEVAYGADDYTGCPTEPSARVRRMARLALAGCGGLIAERPMPLEGPGDPDILEDAGPPAALEFTTNPSSPSRVTASPAVDWQPLAPTHRSPPLHTPCRSCAPTTYLEVSPPPSAPAAPHYFPGR